MLLEEARAWTSPLFLYACILAEVVDSGMEYYLLEPLKEFNFLVSGSTITGSSRIELAAGMQV